MLFLHLCLIACTKAVSNDTFALQILVKCLVNISHRAIFSQNFNIRDYEYNLIITEKCIFYISVTFRLLFIIVDDSWSMKVILHQEVCLSLWNIWFLHVLKNRCVEYFTMINILPDEVWLSYFTNNRTHIQCFNSWSMKIILHQEGCVSSWNIQHIYFSWRVKIKYFTMIHILPIEGWFSYFTN